MSQITRGSPGLPEKAPRNSLARRGVALLILAVVGYLVLSTLIHAVLAIATIVVVVAAVIWAARVLF
ncbi:MAG TPA: hypothetical protein VG165_01530 [Solirubrobacteraceae bacterium]|jgi:hypothetical protein|nr:hypothetical protein [Solirubrobacteraceae bacterium]